LDGHVREHHEKKSLSQGKTPQKSSEKEKTASNPDGPSRNKTCSKGSLPLDGMKAVRFEVKDVIEQIGSTG
jgi:hypothetical protein